MKKYPYVPADLVKAVDSVLDKRENIVEQDLRRRHRLDEMDATISYEEAKANFDRPEGSAFTEFYVRKNPEHAIKWLLGAPSNHPNRKRIEQELTKTFASEEKNLTTEAPVVGVIKGQLPGDQHMCATKIFSEEFGEGIPVYSMHAEPDEHGLIEWYDVMFEHGIERVFTADVQVLTERMHGHMKKKKKMGMKSEMYTPTPNIPRPPKDEGVSRDEVPGLARSKAEMQAEKDAELKKKLAALRSEAKEEPTGFDIEKSLPTNAHRSGYQVARKSTNKADLKHAISQVLAHKLEHPEFHEKMLRALGKAQNAKEVLDIAADFLKSQQTGPSKPKRYPFMDKDEPVVKEHTITSVIKRLRESKESQGMLPFDTGLDSTPLHHRYKYKDGWEVVDHPDDHKSGFRTLQRVASSGNKIHIVKLEDHVRTVGDLRNFLATNPPAETHTRPASGEGAWDIKHGNLFQTVAWDRS